MTSKDEETEGHAKDDKGSYAQANKRTIIMRKQLEKKK